MPQQAIKTFEPFIYAKPGGKTLGVGRLVTGMSKRVCLCTTGFSREKSRRLLLESSPVSCFLFPSSRKESFGGKRANVPWFVDSNDRRRALGVGQITIKLRLQREEFPRPLKSFRHINLSCLRRRQQESDSLKKSQNLWPTPKSVPTPATAYSHHNACRTECLPG